MGILETIKEVFAPDMQTESAQIIADQKQRQAAERTEAAARQQAEYERVMAYLAQPRRTSAEVQASIAAVQDERAAYARRLVELEAEAIASDEPVSPKQTSEVARLNLSITTADGRLQKLAAELADAQRAAFLQHAHDTIKTYAERAEALLTFERDEFAELEARYKAAAEHRANERQYLRGAIMNLMEESRRTNHQFNGEVDALKAAYPHTSTIWK